MEEVIKQFLLTSSGYGDGSGSGYGSGDGSGYGYGIKSYNGYEVYIIDDMQTIIQKQSIWQRYVIMTLKKNPMKIGKRNYTLMQKLIVSLRVI